MQKVNQKNSNAGKPLGSRRVVVRRGLDRVNVFLAIAALLIIVIGVFQSWILFDLNVTELVIVSAFLLIFYLILLVFLLQSTTTRYVHRTKFVENPVIKEIVREVEKPVEVIREVEKPVYIQVEPVTKPTKGKRYDFVASVETKVVHPASSRLARLIRPKNRLYGDDLEAFIKRGYKLAEKTKDKLRDEGKKVTTVKEKAQSRKLKTAVRKDSNKNVLTSKRN